MRVLIQRVTKANVIINNQMYSSINKGLLALIGIEKGDTEEQIIKLSKKIVNLRIFEDENNKMNRSILDIQGQILLVSQFTLCSDCKKGTRPSFDNAEEPKKAQRLYEQFIKAIKYYNIETKTGEFGADMQVSLINDGPVTFMLEAKNG